jgi:hypothetical protein
MTWEESAARRRYASMSRLATFAVLVIASCAGPPAVLRAGTIAPPHPTESVVSPAGLSVAATPASPDFSSRTSSAVGEVLLYDPEVSNGRAWATSPTLFDAEVLTQAARKQILDSVFKNNYLTSEDQCIEAAVGMSQADHRMLGDIVPIVHQVAIGSFTQRRVDERLYLISACECNASARSARFGTAVLAVFRGDAVVSRVLLDGNMYHIRLVSDLDGDSQNELLILWDSGGGGDLYETAQLVRIEDSQLVVIKDFGEVEDMRCGGGRPDPGFRSSRLYVTPGSPPSFRVQERVGSCPWAVGEP